VRVLLQEDGTEVVQRLQDKNKFRTARDGDHLLCPFQCDLCHFRNLKNRDPLRSDYTDRNLLNAIRRSNLDSFWGRASTTVAGNLLSMLNIVRTMRDKYGVSSEVPYFPPQGPHPLEDNFGMFASCVMLEHSLNPGITAATVQFGTIRKTRSALSNYSATTRSELTESVLVGGKNKGERWNFSATPMYGLWFNRFKDGCHSRMGDDIRPDKAMSIELILEIQKLYEIKLFDCTSHKDVLEVCLNAVFHIVSFVGGFRGEEMPMLSLDAIGKYLAYGQPADPKLAHVMIALRGRVKGEHKAEACHLIPIAAVTKSGLKPRLWVARAVEAYARLGITHGWMFRDPRGAAAKQKKYEPMLFSMIQEVINKETLPEHILPKATDVAVDYGIGRSGRRGYATHATNENISDPDIKRLARWRSVENAAGKQANVGGTKESYSDIMMMLKTLLRATRDL
jgi:hypothetical protein